jgi:hypothetical protein
VTDSAAFGAAGAGARIGRVFVRTTEATVFFTAGSIGFRNTPGSTPMKIAIAHDRPDHDPLPHAEIAQPLFFGFVSGP